MDRLDKYRDVIKKILTEYHSWANNSNIKERESCLVFDDVHDQYFWFKNWSEFFLFILTEYVPLKKINQTAIAMPMQTQLTYESQDREKPKQYQT